MWPTLLLCLCIAAASLDRVPDPPAVSQNTIRLQGVQLDHQADGVVPVHLHAVLESGKPHSSTRWSIVRQIRPCVVEVPELVHRASDPSPPSLPS